jgi:hypothetical protein
MKKLILLAILALSLSATAQNMTGSELLDKTIAYHDPNGNWATLGTKITFAEDERNGKMIKQIVEFKNGGDYFKGYRSDGEHEVVQLLDGEICTLTLDGSSDITDEEREKHRLNPDRAKMMRNYYVYLYGLPMKLKDKGTQIDEKVTRAEFMGKEYLKLKATYDAAVGKDTWYFYIHPETYEMSAYQFFHDESTNDGEYITLEGMVEVDGIKIPKQRTWYMNIDDKLLGVDDIAKIEVLE